MNPILVTLFASGGAAATAALGVLPVRGRQDVPESWIGWANALAAGMMLGTAFALGVAEGEAAVPAAIGALAGILFIAWTHAVTGTEDLALNRLDEQEPAYGYRVALVQTLHAGSEGIAIGAAMAVSLSFGLFTAATMAVHNIPEATVLAAVLRGRGTRLPGAALQAVATNVPQVFVAVSTYAVVAAAPGLLSWTLGLGTGMLANLVLVELLPESYRQAGHTSIAVVTSAALAMVVLLNAWAL